MLRSLFSGITGLRAHQNLMDVVSNNISNVNTTGFKSSSVIFEDTLSQLVKAAGAPTANSSNNLGGVNPAQVGLGVQLGGISTNFGQGSAQNTGKSTDLMIQGDGFFVARNGGEQVYTRAGALSFDTNGSLVTPTGMVIQGWLADSTGTVNTNASLTDIKVAAGSMIPPKPTNNAAVGGNITNGAAGPLTLGTVAYDASGNAHTLSIVLTSNPAGGYDVAVSEPALSTPPPTPTTVGTITFNPDGSPITPVPSPNPLSTYALPDGTTVQLDLSAVSNYGGPGSLAVTKTDGSAAGSLQQFQIGADGTVTGLYSNGVKQNLATIALANFNNPQGLEKMGDTAYRSSANSGLAQIGTPGSGGRGTLLGGELEMSNVDLAQEFTNLIIAQRGFQANSKVITTSDQMLQDLVDLKR